MGNQSVVFQVNSDKSVTVQSLPGTSAVSLTGGLKISVPQSQVNASVNFNAGDGIAFTQRTWVNGPPAWIKDSLTPSQIVLELTSPEDDDNIYTLLIYTNSGNVSFTIMFGRDVNIPSPSSGLTVCSLTVTSGQAGVAYFTQLSENLWVNGNLQSLGDAGGVGDSYTYTFNANAAQQVQFLTGQSGVQWLAPAFIQAVSVRNTSVSFTSVGSGGVASANFYLNTNNGTIDPTVVSSPDI